MSLNNELSFNTSKINNDYLGKNNQYEVLYDVIPLIYNDSLDTNSIQNILLIDSTVQEYREFVHGCNANTFPIVYDYHSDRNELKTILSKKFNNIQRIAFVFHNSNMNNKLFLNNQYFFSDSDLETVDNFSENIQFLLGIIQDFHVDHLDYLACNSLDYDNWKKYYDIFSTNTSVIIGASINETGNMKYGGDWIMETTNENVKAIYFNENINHYKKTLTNPAITPSITNFSISSKTYGDASFTIVDPSSNSAGKFRYDSTDIEVAIIDDNTINITGAGTTVITATQDACGNFLDGSSSIVFTVSPSIPSSTKNYNDGYASSPLIVASFKIALISDSFNSDVNIKTFGGIVFYKNTRSIKNLSYNNGNYTEYYTTEIINSITSNFFNNNKNLLYVILGNTFTSIENDAFNGCNAIVLILLPSVTNIGDYAFKDCTELNSISLPNVTNISNNAFAGCPSMTVYTLYANNYVYNYSYFPYGSIVILTDTLMQYITYITNFSIPTKTYGDESFTITDPSSNRSGSFNYQSSNTSVATISNNTITILKSGTSTITATQPSTANYTSGSITAIFTVNKKKTTISNWTIPATTYGTGTITLTAPISDSMGTFTYTSSDTNVATILNNTITILKAGTSIIAANQSATEYYTSDSTTALLTVNKAIPTITNFSIPATYVDASFTITDPSSNSSGNFRYQSSNTSVATIYNKTITITGLGTTIITAIQDAYGNYLDGSANTTLSISISIPSITNFIIPTKTYGDASFTITDPYSNSPANFSYQSSNTSVATIYNKTVTINGAGTSTITVRQDACGNYLEGYSTITFTVNKQTTNITNFSIPTKTYGDASFTITDPSSNSPANFSYQTSNTSVVTINNKTVIINRAGTSTITAYQYATDNYTYGSANTIFIVNGIIPSIANFTIPTKKYGDVSFIIVDPSSNSLGNFRYQSSNTAVATINNKNVTINGLGTSIITVIQDAFGNYADISANTIFTVIKGAPSITGFIIPSKTYGDASFIIVDPSSNSSGDFRYQSSNTAVATITDKIVIINGLGTTIITAIQDACGNFLDGSANTTFTVNKQIPSITNFSIPIKIYGSAAFQLVDPFSTSNGAFRYQSSNTKVVTISNKTVTINGVGTSIITAIQDACGNNIDGSANATCYIASLKIALISNSFNSDIESKTFGGIVFYKDTTTIQDLSYNNGKYTVYYTTSNITTLSSNYFSQGGIGNTKLLYIQFGKSITYIGDSALKNCTSLNYVTIPSSVNAIGNNAFQGCSSLNNIIMNGYSPIIGTSAFAGTSNTITISGNIPNYLFNGVTSLTTLIIDTSIKSIGTNAFYGCSNLNNITINSSSILTVNSNAFQGTSNTITLSGNIPDYLFNGVISLINVNVNDTITTIGSYAFQYCYNIKSFNLGSNVKNLNSYSFANCNGLTSITIPNSVTNIGDHVFQNCSSLNVITIQSSSIISIGTAIFTGLPPSITLSGSIPSNVFSGITTLQNITIGTNTTSIGNSAFKNCSGITSVSINSNIMTSINEYSFQGCSNLTSIAISSNITVIGISAFQNCSKLTYINIPSNVQSIGLSAFQNCSKLTYINIPANVQSIGASAFNNCSLLNTIEIQSSSITSIGQYAFTGLPASITISGFIPSNAFAAIITFTNITIGTNTTSIGNAAFQGCSNLISITIPENIRVIDNYVFKNCSKITSITIPPNVTAIGISAFENCSKITSITIPPNVTAIGAYAFQKCTLLNTITIKSSIVSTVGISAFSGLPVSITVSGFIPSNAFTGITTLKNVTIGNNTTSIGTSAFQGCSGITSITIPSNLTTIGTSAFQGCSGITSITIPISVVTIGTSAFQGCSKLSIITIESSSITSIGASAFTGLPASITVSGSIPANIFTGLTAITNLVFGTNTKNIGSSAFKNCSNIKTLNIPSSVTNIYGSAFQGCSRLTSISIPSSIISIQTSVFEGCSAIKSIIIPSTITNLGERAFYGCSSVTYIAIPSSVTNIDGSTFQSCSRLTSISIPNSIKSIQTSIFEGCSSLSIITIPDSVTTISERAFYGCSSISTVTIPSKVTLIGTSAFKNCSKLINVYFLCNNNNFDLQNIIDNKTNLMIYYTNNTTEWTSTATSYKIYPAPLIANTVNNTINGTCNNQITNVYIYNIATKKQYILTSKNGSWTYRNAPNGNYSTIGFLYDPTNYSSYCKSIP